MTVFEKELQRLKSHDQIQSTVKCEFSGYDFITTAGHGYLVIPMTDKFAFKALSILKYGFKGDRAIYLEEDCEAPEFIYSIKAVA